MRLYRIRQFDGGKRDHYLEVSKDESLNVLTGGKYYPKSHIYTVANGYSEKGFPSLLKDALEAINPANN